MKFNIVSISYLFFRLAPFILICFFALASFFNQDFKGIIYLAGLILTAFVSAMITNGMNLEYPSGKQHDLCSLVEIGENDEFSKAPLSLTIYGYTFSYLLYVIVKYNFVLQNIPTIVFFPLMILMDITWNMNYNCYSMSQVAASLGIAAALGLGWAALFDSFGIAELQYFMAVKGKGKDSCDIPKKTTFRCRVFKNGRLIGKI